MNERCWSRLPIVVFALLVVACSRSHSVSNETDSTTQWLEKCVNDDSCGPLSCLCGACGRECTNDSTCSDLAANAACRRDTSCGSAVLACVVECSGNDDCARIPGASCDHGSCRRTLAAAIDGGERAADLDAGNIGCPLQPPPDCDAGPICDWSAVVAHFGCAAVNPPLATCGAYNTISGTNVDVGGQDYYDPQTGKLVGAVSWNAINGGQSCIAYDPSFRQPSSSGCKPLDMPCVCTPRSVPAGGFPSAWSDRLAAASCPAQRCGKYYVVTSPAVLGYSVYYDVTTGVAAGATDTRNGVTSCESYTMAPTAVFTPPREACMPLSNSGCNSWLKACSRDDECAGLSCRCGFCSHACGSSSCGDVNTAAVCTPAASLGCNDSQDICATHCGLDLSCPGDTHCVVGWCVAGKQADGGAVDASADAGQF